MRSEDARIVPPHRWNPGKLFNLAGRIFAALVLALTLLLGLSHISAAAPDSGAEMAKTQLHHDDNDGSIGDHGQVQCLIVSCGQAMTISAADGLGARLNFRAPVKLSSYSPRQRLLPPPIPPPRRHI